MSPTNGVPLPAAEAFIQPTHVPGKNKHTACRGANGEGKGNIPNVKHESTSSEAARRVVEP